MRIYVVTLISILSACTKSKIEINQNSNLNTKITQETNFKQIGSEELVLFDFPKHWYVKIYDDAPSMSKEDSLNQKKIQELDFFDAIEGKTLDKDKYSRILLEKGEKLDSLFLVNSFSIKNHNLIYVKYYKTLNDKGYDFPPKARNIDVLIYNKNKFVKTVNIYSNKDYPYAVEKKIGYLDKSGILYTKTFEIDEEGINYTKSEKINLKNYLK